ncbi:MAG: glycosyltransferase family 4 protein [Emcibacteraceae bacterium]|nr:glycosyltransferase family 4 protein [Emcibacteraceae bacterium]
MQKKLIFFVFPIKFFLSHRLPIAQKAIEEGYDVHLVSTSGDGESVLSENGIIFHEVKVTRSKANPFQEVSTIFQVYKIYKKIKPDIVHHITIKPVLYGTLAARLARVKSIVNAFSGLGYVFTAKGFKAGIIRNIIKIAYRIILRNKKLTSIVQNHDDMRFLQSISAIKADQAVLIKGSGVDLSEFSVKQEPDNIPVVIIPARLLKDKGVVEFVKAAEILKNKNIKVRMALVGDIDVGNPSSVTKKEILNWVELGWVEHWEFSTNMSETIQKANVICLPSYREGMPKALIEATASARAIITTDVPGCREMIDLQNINGILIPPKDSLALATAIEELINDPKKRHQMALNGRKMAEREFSIDQVVDKTLEIYDNLLD